MSPTARCDQCRAELEWATDRGDRLEGHRCGCGGTYRLIQPDAAPQRVCGGCTQCCKTMKIPALEKPADRWCRFCAVGEGCRIYPDRPAECAGFQCLWLRGWGSDRARPDRTKVVLVASQERGRPPILGVHCDPHRPDAWKTGEVGDLVRTWSRDGGIVSVRAGGYRQLIATTVEARREVDRIVATGELGGMVEKSATPW
jgi:hypothetical protein